MYLLQYRDKSHLYLFLFCTTFLYFNCIMIVINFKVDNDWAEMLQRTAWEAAVDLDENLTVRIPHKQT